MSGVNLAPRPSRRALREAERAGRPPASHVGTFRKDIQGLRAIAVLLVLLAHGGIPGFSGGFVGVDVFFVLSGFLITGIIVREIDKTGRLRLWNFWARRIRRLLPAASVVLIFVTLGTMLTLPLSRWLSIAGDVLGGAFTTLTGDLRSTRWTIWRPKVQPVLCSTTGHCLLRSSFT